MKRRVGIVGYGHLGQYLAKALQEELKNCFEIAFVYNRNPDCLADIPESKRLQNLDDFASKQADLIVEVAHPNISERYAAQFLQHADYMAGSPTAFANHDLEKKIREVVKTSPHGLYLPRGAMWYLDRILALDSEKKLKEMKIAMKKHPSSIKYDGPLDIPLEEIQDETIIYQGNVRQVCQYAPNNVNTMAVAALAAGNLGMDNVQAQLVADPKLHEHIIEIELYGPGEPGKRYAEKAQRYNPAAVGAVTGSATYKSFLESLQRAQNQGSGIHFC